MELDREGGCTRPSGVDGMRNDDGAVALRVVAVAGVTVVSVAKDGRAGR